jgi:WD40 repeat protein
MYSRREVFFCLLWKILILFVVCLLFISSSWACTRKTKVGNFDSSKVLEYVYLAHPDGGIRAYSSQNKEIIVITEALDYHPGMLKSGLLYFLRYAKADQDGKHTSPASLMAWNSQDNKIQKIKTINSLPFTPELKSQIFFLDEGKKLLLLSHSKGNQLINLELDTRMPDSTIKKYLPEINYSTNDGQELFVNLFQYPYQNVIKSKESIEAPPSRSAILSINKDFSIKVWDETSSKEMFEHYYYGCAFDQQSHLLFISKDSKLYSYSKAGDSGFLIGEGIHPFVVHQSSTQDFASFPLLTASILWEDQARIFLGAENYLSYFDLKTESYTPFQARDFNLTPKDIEDPAFLFNRLTYLARFKELPSSYWLVSANKEKLIQNDEASTLKRDQVDALVFFSILERGIVGHWQSSGQMYPEIWIEDLDNDGHAEFLNYYCLSSFKCPGEILLNGRYLVWLDIVGQNAEGNYERKNEAYPALYRELWERLDLVKKEHEASERNRRAFLCDEDLQSLNNMLNESHRIATQ